jgi:hypothetical protein
MHALQRMRERGAHEEDVHQAIRIGRREPAQRGLFLYRLNVEFKREWDGRYMQFNRLRLSWLRKNTGSS